MPELTPHLTPVIIPAFHEAAHIAHTLDHLDADLVLPIVAVNGERDATAEIAEQYGAKVIQCAQQGKLPAIQEALTSLGNHALLPLIVLDADTYPLFPRRWHNRMLSELTIERDAPQVVSGPAIFTGTSHTYAAVHSMRRWRNSYGIRATHHPTLAVGANLGLHIKTEDMLDNLLSLPHIWQGDDAAIVDTVIDNGGEFNQSFKLNKMVITPLSASYPGLLESIRMGKAASQTATREAYIRRGAPGSITYKAFLTCEPQPVYSP